LLSLAAQRYNDSAKDHLEWNSAERDDVNVQDTTMADAKDSKAPPDSETPPPPRPPVMHEAEREPGLSGAVLRGDALELAAAVARRRMGADVVICGPDMDANRRQTYQVEAAVGPVTRPQSPHTRAGPMALPHFHQRNRSPEGHTFYETSKRKTKRKP
jgi:hypothetical protein